MKFFLIFAVLMMSAGTFANDVIVTRDSKKIDAKILEVSNSEIKYKETDNLDGPTFVLDISEISRITYSNGKVQLYDVQEVKSETNQKTTIAKTTSINAEKQSTPDIVHTLSGEELFVKVQNISQGFLFYKDWDNPNGKTFTMNTAHIHKIHFSNGIIQVYNSNLTPTNSVVLNNENNKNFYSEPKYIMRSGNKYIYDGRIMQGRVFNNHAYSKFLETKCEAAYDKFKHGTFVASFGWGFFITGVTLDLGFFWFPYSGLGAFVCEIASIPLLITGYCQMHQSAEIFNMQCANNTSYSWSINSSKDGIGIAFNF